MLVPKSEKDEFRMVGDLCNLNRYIKEPPTSSPSIQQAKEALAKKRFFAHIPTLTSPTTTTSSACPGRTSSGWGCSIRSRARFAMLASPKD